MEQNNNWSMHSMTPKVTGLKAYMYICVYAIDHFIRLYFINILFCRNTKRALIFSKKKRDRECVQRSTIQYSPRWAWGFLWWCHHQNPPSFDAFSVCQVKITANFVEMPWCRSLVGLFVYSLSEELFSFTNCRHFVQVMRCSRLNFCWGNPFVNTLYMPFCGVYGW